MRESIDFISRETMEGLLRYNFLNSLAALVSNSMRNFLNVIFDFFPTDSFPFFKSFSCPGNFFIKLWSGRKSCFLKKQLIFFNGNKYHRMIDCYGLLCVNLTHFNHLVLNNTIEFKECQKGG